jgi:hypothetical protein
MGMDTKAPAAAMDVEFELQQLPTLQDHEEMAGGHCGGCYGCSGCSHVF